MKLLALAAIVFWSGAAPAQQPVAPQAAPSTASAQGPSVALAPASVSIKRGSSAQVTVTVSPRAGEEGNVGLVCSLLYDTKMTFAPQVIDGGRGTSTLTIAPGRSALKGSYLVSITAVSPAGSRVATVEVKIR